MGKLKTHKGTKKVLKVRKGGTISVGHPGSRHNTGDKSRSFNRRKRKSSVLAKGDARRLKNIIK